jgi:hypothetical protein
MNQIQQGNFNDAIRLSVELDEYYKTEIKGDFCMLLNASSEQPAQMTEFRVAEENVSKVDTCTLEKEVHDKVYRQDLTMQESKRSARVAWFAIIV